MEDDELPPGHLSSLVNAIRPAVDAAIASKPKNLLLEATLQNAKMNAQLAQTADPLLSELNKEGRLKAAGAFYDIATG